MSISLIACIDRSRGIGNNGKLLYRIKEDMQHFKELTKGHVVVMGRGTYESLPNGALTDRVNVVISKTLGVSKDRITYRSVEGFLIGHRYHEKMKGKEIFVIGGQSIYEAFINSASHLYITHVDHEKYSDRKFPEIDTDKWSASVISDYKHCDINNVRYNFVTYSRKERS